MDWVISFYDFIKESNRIEGIHREPTRAESDAHVTFLALPRLTVADVSALVAVCAPGHVLRERVGMNVRVGSHIAPCGGIGVVRALMGIVERVATTTPHKTHVAYENLHPYTDGNGRSGRAIWLWAHLHGAPGAAPERALELGFLHTFYYEALSASDERTAA